MGPGLREHELVTLASLKGFALFIGADLASRWFSNALESESPAYQARALELGTAAFGGYCDAAGTDVVTYSNGCFLTLGGVYRRAWELSHEVNCRVAEESEE